MICIVQRVSSARVEVIGEIVGKIDAGLLVLAAVERDDTQANMEWIAGKLVSLRIFANVEKNFDLDVKQTGGAILLVSNFTVAADTRNGRRPSLIAAASPQQGEVIFNQLIESVRAQGVTVQTGRFGADMQIHLVNDGPSTFIVQTDRKPNV